jgi:hypothetical protein
MPSKKNQNRTCTKKHNKAKQNDERRSIAHEEGNSNKMKENVGIEIVKY